MELRHLRYFVAVAEAGHMTRAAAALGIQQPPLSQQMKALENELGLQLLRRHPKGVSLTEGGRLLLGEARRVLADVEMVRLRMDGMARGIRGTLAIGFTSSAAAHAFTPKALRACRSRFPDIELVLSESNAAEITESIADGRLHCGLLRVPVARPVGLTLQTLLSEPTMIAIPRDHRLAKSHTNRRAPVALKELHGEQLILVRRPGAPGLYANLLTLCARHSVVPVVVAEVERMMTNLNLVAAGVGLSVVPASMQGAHRDAVVYRPLPASVRLDAPLTLVYRSADCVGPTATFVGLAREIAEATDWRTKQAAQAQRTRES
jgi:DNA-binding transcriptional LysR family regulator